MANMKGKNIYAYIYKSHDGYKIQKDNEHYGFYHKLEDALFDRDRLDQVDWDMSVFVELPEIPNPYYNMRLPPFERVNEYIDHLPERWRVRKDVNGKRKYYGTFTSYEEAEQRVNELIDKNWED